MKLTFVIEVTDDGVRCHGDSDGEDVYGSARANLMAVGALEIAMSSLLAQRWGLRNNHSLGVGDKTEENEGQHDT